MAKKKSTKKTKKHDPMVCPATGARWPWHIRKNILKQPNVYMGLQDWMNHMVLWLKNAAAVDDGQVIFLHNTTMDGIHHSGVGIQFTDRGKTEIHGFYRSQDGTIWRKWPRRSNGCQSMARCSTDVVTPLRVLLNQALEQAECILDPAGYIVQLVREI